MSLFSQFGILGIYYISHCRSSEQISALIPFERRARNHVFAVVNQPNTKDFVDSSAEKRAFYEKKFNETGIPWSIDQAYSKIGNMKDRLKVRLLHQRQTLHTLSHVDPFSSGLCIRKSWTNAMQLAEAVGDPSLKNSGGLSPCASYALMT